MSHILISYIFAETALQKYIPVGKADRFLSARRALKKNPSGLLQRRVYKTTKLDATPYRYLIKEKKQLHTKLQEIELGYMKKCGYISEAASNADAVRNRRADIESIEHYLFYRILQTLNNNGSYRLPKIQYIIYVGLHTY